MAVAGDARVVEAIVPRVDAGDRYRDASPDKTPASGYHVVADPIVSFGDL